MFRSIMSSLYFNFHYLPFNQAIHLPILLYKPRLLKCRGQIRIVSDNIKTGMIKLGIYEVSIYPNNGIMIQNDGGIITFYGSCKIGNNSYLSIGSNGILNFGANFNATASLKIVAYHNITFENDVLVGWENTFVDNDAHQVSYTDKTKPQPKPYGKVHIGKGCWFAYGNYIMKNTNLPDYCVIAAKSVLNKDYKVPNCSLLAGIPATLKRTGIYLDKSNDIINYPPIENHN